MLLRMKKAADFSQKQRETPNERKIWPDMWMDL